jgi:quercetin dioxygenase-like cupin family protein
MPMLERRRVSGEQAMLCEIRLRAGCVVPSHSHPNEQFAYVISGNMKFGLGIEGSSEYREVTLRPGEVLHLPSNLHHSATAVVDSVVLDVFSPPSAATGIDIRPTNG